MSVELTKSQRHASLTNSDINGSKNSSLTSRRCFHNVITQIIMTSSNIDICQKNRCNGGHLQVVIWYLVTWLLQGLRLNSGISFNFDVYQLSDCSHSYSIIESINEVNSRIKRQATTDCPRWKFLCADGKTCIPRTSRCDGKIDCPDQSDESTNCRDERCPPNTFQCTYGACVPGKARCDKNKDCADNSDENDCDYKENVTTKKTLLPGASACKASQFVCKNGQCVSRLNKCDGVKHCSDGSDEIAEICKDEICPSNSFQCRYGACLNAKVKCDRKKDCPDNSDEDTSMCFPYISKNVTSTLPENNYNNQSMSPSPTSGSNEESCKIPTTLKNGKLKVVGWNSELVEGNFIPPGRSLELKCNPGYVLSSENLKYIPCDKGQWVTNSFPTCIRTCPPRKSLTVDFQCSLRGMAVRCDDPIKEGTIIKMKCKEHHQRLRTSLYYPSIATCKDGSWDNDILPCEPICGVRPKSKPLVIQGQDTLIEIHPWHVGIYRLEDNKYKHICGGTLINVFTVVSAAHCFTDPQDNKVQKKETFLIAAGKNYRDLDDSRDAETIQKRMVRKIVIHESYRGYTQSYSADIALIQVDKNFELTNTVALACIDWNSNYNEIPKESMATVVGWGVTEIGGNLGDPLLKKLTVPFLTKEDCEKMAPSDFQPFIRDDKYCAGYLNGSSVCTGDSGGGLITKDSLGFHTLRGIVSTSPVKGNTCDNDQIATYTKISTYVDFLQKANMFVLN